MGGREDVDGEGARERGPGDNVSSCVCVCVRERVCVFMCVCVRVCKYALFLATLCHPLISRCFSPCMRTCPWSECSVRATHELPGSAHPLDRPTDRPPGLQRAHASRIHVTPLGGSCSSPNDDDVFYHICTFSKTRACGGAIH